MLVLSRKEGQRLVIDVPGFPSPIEIKVARITRGRVSIGVTAPIEIRVVRGELKRLPVERVEEGEATE